MDRFDSVMFIAPIMYILPMDDFLELCRECQINWRKDKWNLKENSGIGLNRLNRYTDS